MTRRSVFIVAVILALSSIGFADRDRARSDMEWDAEHMSPDITALVFWWEPDALIALGYMGQDAIVEPGLGAIAQSGYIVSAETTGPGTQSTYVSVSHVSTVSGDGNAWIDADVVVVTSQSTP